MGYLYTKDVVGLWYNTSRGFVFCKGSFSYSKYQGEPRSMSTMDGLLYRQDCRIVIKKQYLKLISHEPHTNVL